MLTGFTGLLLAQPLRPVVFVGESMGPTYPNKSIAWSIPYLGHLHKGDIVVIDTGRSRIVKRVAYLEGDRMAQVKVKEEWVDGVDFRLSTYRLRHRDLYREVLVPPGTIYVLGDNPPRSIDSRQLGCFQKSQVRRVIIKPRPRQEAVPLAGFEQTLPS